MDFFSFFKFCVKGGRCVEGGRCVRVDEAQACRDALGTDSDNTWVLRADPLVLVRGAASMDACTRLCCRRGWDRNDTTRSSRIVGTSEYPWAQSIS